MILKSVTITRIVYDVVQFFPINAKILRTDIGKGRTGYGTGVRPPAAAHGGGPSLPIFVRGELAEQKQLNCSTDRQLLLVLFRRSPSKDHIFLLLQDEEVLRAYTDLNQSQGQI